MSFVAGVEQRKGFVEIAAVVFVEQMREFMADEVVDNFWRRHDDLPVVSDRVVVARAAEYAVCAASRACTPTGSVGTDFRDCGREVRVGFL